MKRPTRTIGIIGAAAALVTVSGIAGASIPGPNGVVSACYISGQGAVRVIDAATQKCKSNETAISWSQTGPQGTAGADGLDGEDGQAGQDGAPGANGINGVSGYEVRRSSANDYVFGNLNELQDFSDSLNCPTGKRAISGGGSAYILRGSSTGSYTVPVVVAHSIPSANETSWSVRFTPRDGNILPGDIGNWEIFVICANVTP